MPSRKSSRSNADTPEAMGEFWDAHDFADFDTDVPDMAFTVSSAVALEPDLLSALEKQAKMRGVSVETLVNIWLQEKLVEASRA